MLYIQYNTESEDGHVFALARNNPETGFAQVKRDLLEQDFRTLFPDDGAIASLVALAKECPNIWHVVPNRQAKPKARTVWGAIVQ